MMEKKKFTCSHCKFNFARYERPVVCPYCSKTSTVIDASFQSADDFLREVE